MSTTSYWPEECNNCNLLQSGECEGRLEGELPDGCPDFEPETDYCQSCRKLGENTCPGTGADSGCYELC